MKIFNEKGRFTPEWLEKRWNLSLEVQIKLLRDVESAILALAATEDGPDKALKRLDKLTEGVLRYRDMKVAENMARLKLKVAEERKRNA